MGENNSIPFSEAPRPEKGRGASLFFKMIYRITRRREEGEHMGPPPRES